MPNQLGFGGTSSPSGYTSEYAYADTVDITVGRLMLNGQGPIIVTHLFGYAAGRGAARSMSMSLGIRSTSSFSVAAASSATAGGGTGYQPLPTDLFVANGTSNTRFRMNFTGSTYFARGGTGTTYDNIGSYVGALGGAYQYVEGPNGGGIPVVTPLGGGKASLTWNAPTSNGGSEVYAYRIQYATNSAFTTGVGTVDTANATAALTVTGLTPGVTYWFRVAAMNAVTAAAGTTSIWGGATSALMLSGGKVWNGTAWAPSTSSVWNGTSWALGTSLVWNGTAWVNAQ